MPAVAPSPHRSPPPQAAPPPDPLPSPASCWTRTSASSCASRCRITRAACARGAATTCRLSSASCSSGSGGRCTLLCQRSLVCFAMPTQQSFPELPTVPLFCCRASVSPAHHACWVCFPLHLRIYLRRLGGDREVNTLIGRAFREVRGQAGYWACEPAWLAGFFAGGLLSSTPHFPATPCTRPTPSLPPCLPCRCPPTSSCPWSTRWPHACRQAGGPLAFLPACLLAAGSWLCCSAGATWRPNSEAADGQGRTWRRKAPMPAADCRRFPCLPALRPSAPQPGPARWLRAGSSPTCRPCWCGWGWSTHTTRCTRWVGAGRGRKGEGKGGIARLRKLRSRGFMWGGRGAR